MTGASSSSFAAPFAGVLATGASARSPTPYTSARQFFIALGVVRAKVTSRLRANRRSSATKVTIGSSAARISFPSWTLTGTTPKSWTIFFGTMSATAGGMRERERSTNGRRNCRHRPFVTCTSSQNPSSIIA
jgi:hypothetical protein